MQHVWNYDFYGRLRFELTADRQDLQEISTFLDEQWWAFRRPDTSWKGTARLRVVVASHRDQFQADLSEPSISLNSDGVTLNVSMASERAFFEWWPWVEFTIEVGLARSGLLPIHASLVGGIAGCVLIAGHSGAGKTMLSLAIGSTKDALVLADDGCFLAPNAHVYPYPRPPHYTQFHLRFGSWLKVERGMDWARGEPFAGQRLAAVLYTRSVPGTCVTIHPTEPERWCIDAWNATVDEQSRGVELLRYIRCTKSRRAWEDWTSSDFSRYRQICQLRTHLGQTPTFSATMGDALASERDFDNFLSQCQTYGIVTLKARSRNDG